MIQDHFYRIAEQEFDRLERELTPRLTADAATRLLAVVMRGLLVPPSSKCDKKRFVDSVNRLLDIYRVRLATENGMPHRLRFLPGGERGLYGYVALIDENGAIVHDLQGKALLLVDAARRFRGNKYVPNESEPLPIVAGL